MKTWSIRHLLVVAGVLFVGAGGAFFASTRGADDPLGPEQVLLDHGILAQWGTLAAEGATPIKITSTFHETSPESKPIFELETWFAPDRYRESRRHFGITEEFGVAGDASWVRVDSTVVPLDEEAAERRRLQLLLMEISSLRALKDGARYAIKHLGRLRVPAVPTEVERLRVRPKSMPGLELMLDFSITDHLLRRVMMRDQRGREMSLLLDDYRRVGPARFAHQLEIYRGLEPYAREIVKSVELGVEVPDSFFNCPDELNRDKFIEKETIAGHMAWIVGGDDADKARKELRSWIADQGLEIVGPFVVVHERAGIQPARPTEPVSKMYIAVSRPAEPTAAAKPTVGFGLVELPPHRALCVTHVGETEIARVVAQLETEARARGLEPSGPALEVYISHDGRTRQIQLPVR